MSERKPCVLVADDSPEVRRMLCRFLPTWGCEVVAACDGREALALAATHPPDLALVDVVMPEPAGIELVRRLKERYPDVAAVIITGYGSIEAAADAMHRGAFYYLSKPLDLRRLRSLVQEVRAKQPREADPTAGMAGPCEALSQREQEVLDALAEAKTDREIASVLRVSVHTIRTHVRNILAKLRVSSRMHAAMWWQSRRERPAHGNSEPKTGPKNT